jgi:hypothetical protein
MSARVRVGGLNKDSLNRPGEEITGPFEQLIRRTLYFKKGAGNDLF